MGTSADVIAITVRALGFIAALQAAGAAMFRAVFADRIAASARSIERLTWWSGLAALVLTAAAQILLPARLVGELAGVLDASLQQLMLASDAGVASSLRMLGLALLLAGTIAKSPFMQSVSIAGCTLTVASFAFMGHTAGGDHRWLSAAVLVLHLLLAAFWFGSLLPLRIASVRESLARTTALVLRFSALAVRLVPFIAVAGAALAALLLPDLQSIATAYGALLLVKAGGFALLMVLAALNKWRFGPMMALGDARALGALRRSVLAEWWIIAAVIAVTAVMTALYSP